MKAHTNGIHAMLLVLVVFSTVCAMEKYPEPASEAWTVLLYFCPPATSAPKLDGVLDDECWKSSPIITDLGAIHVGEGIVKKQTFMQLVYDNEAIYLAARAIEPAISKLKLEKGRDRPIYTGDCIEIYLRPELDKLTRYQLVTNAAGERWDAWITGKARKDESDLSWGTDSTWRAAGRVGEEEWTVEVRLPYSDFGIKPQAGGAFTFNLVRLTWSEGKEFSAWANATYEQKDFRYWAYFVFAPPDLDKRKLIERLLPDYRQRRICWPTLDGLTILDKGEAKEIRYVRLTAEELRELDESLARTSAAISKAEAAGTKLKALPALRDAVKARRDALLRRLESERFSEAGTRQFRERVKELTAQAMELFWNTRCLELLITASQERPR